MDKIVVQKSWVPKILLFRIALVELFLVLVTVVFYKYTIISVVAGILGGIVLIVLLYFLYTFYVLSARGSDLQTKVSELVVEKVDKNAVGNLLDIGCGSGILSVELAMRCPELKIQAIDYWDSIWGYSKEKCEQLAKDCNVSERVCFERASASSLPFDDESFYIIMSNMVFHEVADAKDKRDVIKEALRVLKKDGQFIFQDLFLSKRIYGDPDDLIQYIKAIGVESVSITKTSQQIKIPALLNTPLYFGDVAIISGKK